jgi:hypothetical protein
MRTRWRYISVAVLAVAGMWGASLGDAAGASAGTLIGGAHSVKTTIKIDSHDTLAPPPRHATPKLSAKTAWQGYSRAQVHPKTRPGAGIKIWIGRLTSKHEAHNRLAYAYERKRPTDCLTTLPTSHPKKCREWTFVSANTGKSLGTRQQVLKAK